MMKVGTQNRLYLYTDQSTMIPVEASFLQDQIPGFKEGTATPIEVIYLQEGVTVYHYYSGGETWTGTVPNGVAKIGDTVKVRFQILTTDEFINSLPQVDFVNQEGVNWVANAVKLTDYKLVGDQLTLDFSQDPSADDGEDSGFSVTGQVSQSLGFNSGSGMYLDIHLTDVFAADRTLRIYFDGYGPASLGLDVGKKFGPVYLISFDGVRLRFAYQRTGIIQVATLYPTAPSGPLHSERHAPIRVCHPKMWEDTRRASRLTTSSRTGISRIPWRTKVGRMMSPESAQRLPIPWQRRSLDSKASSWKTPPREGPTSTPRMERSSSRQGCSSVPFTHQVRRWRPISKYS